MGSKRSLNFDTTKTPRVARYAPSQLLEIHHFVDKILLMSLPLPPTILLLKGGSKGHRIKHFACSSYLGTEHFILCSVLSQISQTSILTAFSSGNPEQFLELGSLGSALTNTS